MQFDQEKKGKLERLAKKLYSRNAPNIIGGDRSKLGEQVETDSQNAINEYWQDPKAGGFDELAAKMANMANRKNNFVRKFFAFSLVFFIIAAGVAAFVFLRGSNSVSSKNVDIKVIGPVSIAGGQQSSFDINIINNNNISLESASLLVEYPTSTRSTADPSKELAQERFALGQVKAGESFDQNIKAIFFGEKESVKKIKISLEYRVTNSSALFYKEKEYEVSISSAPVIITPTYPKEVNSNQDITFNVELVSNSKDSIGNFLVNVEYPFGFVFKDASPKASFGNNVWQFSNFSSGQKKTISIKGSIVGQDNEEKVFKINAGTPSTDDERVIAIPFSQSMESVLIKKSFIGIDTSIGGQSGNFAAQGGGQISTDFTIKNNLPSKLFNVSVEVSLGGGAFNGTSVSPGFGGFFQSFNNTILWDKRSINDFSEMSPGSEKELSFNLAPLSYASMSSGSKPEINITFKVQGERILESGSPGIVSATETRKITLSSNIGLSSRSARAVGNIENSGPMPPKPNKPTTYTVVWSVSNSFNQVSNVEVRATLPSYIKWTNIKSPSSEIFSYNPVTHEVVWNVGSLLPNTGLGSSKKEIYFQLEFMPSLSQVGQSPTILGEAALSGIDKVTGSKINIKVPEITTNFSGDPSFKQGDEKVTQ